MPLPYHHTRAQYRRTHITALLVRYRTLPLRSKPKHHPHPELSTEHQLSNHFHYTLAQYRTTPIGPLFQYRTPRMRPSGG
eukprot:2802711-Rhodomonas_salina.2